jgi:hypothetical protein
MSVPDLINGLFEFTGSLALWLNVAALHHDKRVQGVRWYTTAFFFSWGVWNLAYYPMLGQWLSLVGGCSIATANLVWLCQMLYYRRKTAKKPMSRVWQRWVNEKAGLSDDFIEEGGLR